ncbi:MAG: hypothetical protein DRP29_10550 [Thermodesulfobacteriota bacterium]|nr:MAG: hypothetical protein DRP29_10550 [Thermodesulfobacteriota bacterium]
METEKSKKPNLDSVNYLSPKTMRILADRSLLESLTGKYNSSRLKRFIAREEKKASILEDMVRMTIEEKCFSAGTTSFNEIADACDGFVTRLDCSDDDKTREIELLYKKVEKSLEGYVGKPIEITIDEFGVVRPPTPVWDFVGDVAKITSVMAGIYSISEQSVLSMGVCISAIILWKFAAKLKNLINSDLLLGRYIEFVKHGERELKRPAARIEVIDTINRNELLSLDSVMAHEVGHGIFSQKVPIADRRNKKRFAHYAYFLGEGFANYVENTYNRIKAKSKGSELHKLSFLRTHRSLMKKAELAFSFSLDELLGDCDCYDIDDYGFSLAYAACCFVDRKLKYEGTSLLKEVCNNNYGPFLEFVSDGLEVKRK